MPRPTPPEPIAAMPLGSTPSVRRPRRWPRAWPRRWLRPWPARRLLVLPLALLLCHLAWPYATLWRLHQAVVRDDRTAIASLTDLPAIRGALADALDKDRPSPIDRLSDGFIAWLERGLRRHGTAVLDELVTLDWVREELLAQAPPERWPLARLSRAWFAGPRDFRVRLGAPQDPDSVKLRLRLGWSGWRIVALHR